MAEISFPTEMWRQAGSAWTEAGCEAITAARQALQVILEIRDVVRVVAAKARHVVGPPDRDQLAAMAMQGILARVQFGTGCMKHMAPLAYEAADALLAERAKGGGRG